MCTHIWAYMHTRTCAYMHTHTWVDTHTHALLCVYLALCRMCVFLEHLPWVRGMYVSGHTHMCIHAYTRMSPYASFPICMSLYLACVSLSNTRRVACMCVAMTPSTANATTPKSIRSRNSDSSVSRGTDSYWDFGWIWICTKEFEFLDLVDFGGVAIPVETSYVVRNFGHVFWHLALSRMRMPSTTCCVQAHGMELSFAMPTIISAMCCDIPSFCRAGHIPQN